MNRKLWYKLRHDIRASGYSWNWGSRLTANGRSLVTSEARDSKIAFVATTIEPAVYATPRVIDYENPDSGNFMPLYREWAQRKHRGYRTSRIWWQNYMRSNVRRDSRLFTEQLTSY